MKDDSLTELDEYRKKEKIRKLYDEMEVIKNKLKNLGEKISVSVGVVVGKGDLEAGVLLAEEKAIIIETIEMRIEDVKQHIKSDNEMLAEWGKNLINVLAEIGIKLSK